MKKLLLPFLLVFGFTLVSGVLFGQTAPNITNTTTNYPGSPFTYTVGTAITTIGPSNSGGTVPATIYSTVSTFAGSTSGTAGRTQATGTAALFNGAYSIVGDGGTNLYVADFANNEIRKIVVASGVVTNFAGANNGNANFTNGTGTAARFSGPDGIAIDASGNLYIADYYNNAIRKIITSTGVVSTFATGFNGPAGLCFDLSGNLIVADEGNNEIKKVTTGGVVTIIAGTTTAGYTNGTLAAARFNTPNDVQVDASGNIFIADQVNNVIREISTANVVSTFAGSTAGTAGATNATGTSALFNQPGGISMDGGGNFYIADAGNSEIRKITPAGVVTLFAGSATQATGVTDGVGTAALFNNLNDMYIDNTGSMYVADYNNNNIRKVLLSGYTINPNVTTLTGLTFDGTSGKISGTPTTISASTPYVVTAYNYYGSSNANLSITVNPKAPVLTYNPTSYSYTVGAATATINIGNTGGAVTSGSYVFTITSGSLPAGLTFSAANGSFTSTNTTAGSVAGTVNGTNSAGVGSTPPASITITINPAPLATVDYTTAATVPNPPYTFTVGTALPNTIIPTSTNVRTTAPAFSISPTLPGGLTFTATNGQISGNPTAVSGNQLYTVTVYNSVGVAATTTFNIQVVAPPAPTVSYTGTTPAGPNYTFTQYTALPSTIVPSSTNTNSTGGFAISPGVPAGLSFNANTGAITGTPTGTQSSTTYTVTVTGPTGLTGNTGLTITINVAKPGFTYPTPNVYTAPASVSLSPTNTATGGTVPSGGWSISSSPALPAGLTFSTATGVISGTATTATAGALSYTVTGTNSTGSGTFTLTIQVNQVPVISYSPNTYTLPVGTAISPAITPVNNGGAVTNATSYATGVTLTSPGTNPYGMTIDGNGNLLVTVPGNTGNTKIKRYANGANPPLTVGSTLTFNTPFGIVADNTTTNYYVVDNGAKRVYKVNAAGTTSVAFGPTFNSPYAIAIDASNNVYVADNGAGTIVGLDPTGAVFLTITVGANPRNVAVDAAGNIYSLNQGATLTKYDKNGNYISTPISTGITGDIGLAIDNSGNIYVGYTNNVGVYNSNATLLATLSTGLASPRGIAVDGVGDVYVSDYSNSVIEKFVPTNGYFVSNNLPPGIVFSTNTGQFSGTPSLGFPSTTYSVTAYNATGVSSPPASITFKCTTTVPVISYSPATNIYTVGTTITTLTPANTGGPAANFTISATLPAGLSFNPNTGVISGTPTATSPMTIYTITASNSAGTSAATTETITVNPIAPAINYTPSSYSFAAGTAGNTAAPNSTGGAVASYSLDATSPALPGYLTLNTSTGVLSVSTSSVAGTGTYKIDANNSNPSSPGTASITITIVATPSISYTPSTNNYPINATITPLTPTNTGGPVVSTGFGTTGTTVLTGLTTPSCVAVDNFGNVYSVTKAATAAAATVTEYNATTGAVTTPFTGVANVVAMTFDSPGNNAYLLTSTSLTEYTYSAGTYTSSGIAFTVTSGASSITSNGSNIYVGNSTTNRVYKYTAAGGAGTVAVTGSGTYPVSADIAADGSGNIDVVDNSGGSYIDQYTISPAGRNFAHLIDNSSAGSALDVDGSGNLYLTNTTNKNVIVYTASPAFTVLVTETGFTAPTGVAADTKGNFYVLDSSTGKVTQYSALNYNLTIPGGKTLPPGITFNTATGAFIGTPSANFAAVTYSVTANGFMSSVSAPTSVTISCYTSYDWIGATADWQTVTNWESKQLPTSSSPVIIGVNYPFTNAPVVSSTGSANAASVTFGNKGGTAGAAKLAGITVNAGYSLTVAGAITKQSDVNSTSAYISTLSGGGTITAASLSVLPNLTATAAYADGISSTITGTSPAAGLAITGNVSLTSASSPQPATLSFNVTGGVTSVAGTLSTNNASGSTSTFAVSNGTLQLANTAALSALSSSGTNVLSFANTGATIEYSGAAQTVYTDAAITGLTTGPGYQNIKFSGTGVKTPNGTATSNLNIQGDFTNALANTAAAKVVLTGTIVNFNGSGVQNLYGGAGPTLAPGALTTAAPSPTGTVFGNVTINNPAAAANNTKNLVNGGFSVASNGVLTMVGSQSYTSLTTNGNLTLNSDATGSATVAAYTGPLIIGTVHVQRYITGGGATYRGYRLLSAPVTGLSPNANKTDLSYIKYTSYLKGYNGTAGGWDAAGNPNLFLYRENLAPSNATFSSGNYRSITTLYTTTTPNYSYLVDNDGTTPYTVPTGTGYLFYFRGDRHADSIAVEGVAGYASQPAVLTATGVLNHGAVSVTNWYTGTSSLLFTNTTANSVVRGFNLVGNPYASTIDLMTASTTAGSGLEYPAPLVGGKGVETNFYELNPVSQNYDVWSNSLNSGAGGGTNNATRYIVSGQGFFVKADTINQRLTFNESAKINNQNTGPQLFEATNPVDAVQNIRALKTEPIALSKKHNGGEHLRLQMALDSVNTDDIYIGFDPSAQTAYTFNQDALYKQGSGKVSLSSMSSDNVALAINVRPLAKPTNTINLNVSAVANGNYTLNMTELKEIPSLYDVWLMDAYLKDSLDMRQNKTYSFAVALTDTNSFGAKRFSLVIREKPGKGVRLLNFIANKVINGAKVIWKTENELNYTNFTVQRSIDNGKTFDNLNAFVSNDEGSYSFLDTHPVMPADNYRLKITDLNGNISYSDIAPLQYSNLSNNIAKNAITIYPNPTVGPINMAVTQTFKAASFSIQIVNSNGTVVHTTTSATPTWQGDMSKLLPGTYVIQVMNNTDKTVVGKGTFVKL